MTTNNIGLLSIIIKLNYKVKVDYAAFYLINVKIENMTWTHSNEFKQIFVKFYVKLHISVNLELCGKYLAIQCNYFARLSRRNSFTIYNTILSFFDRFHGLCPQKETSISKFR